MRKKLMALLLAMALAFSMAPQTAVPAFAETTDTTDTTDTTGGTDTTAADTQTVTYTVSATGATLADGTTEGTFEFGTPVKLISDTDGQKCDWYVQNADGTETLVASGSSYYVFAVGCDTSIIAKASEETKAKATLAMTRYTRSFNDDGSSKVVMTAQWAVPTNLTISSVKIYYAIAKDASSVTEEKLLTACKNPKQSKLKTSNGTYQLTVNVPAKYKTYGVCAVAVLELTDNTSLSTGLITAEGETEPETRTCMDIFRSGTTTTFTFEDGKYYYTVNAADYLGELDVTLNNTNIPAGVHWSDPMDYTGRDLQSQQDYGSYYVSLCWYVDDLYWHEAILMVYPNGTAEYYNGKNNDEWDPDYFMELTKVTVDGVDITNLITFFDE